QVEDSERHHTDLGHRLPLLRAGLTELEEQRDTGARTRARLDNQRTEIARQLGDVRLELGKLDGDLALAAERLANAAARKLRASEERGQMESRRLQASREEQAARVEHETAERERARAQAELAARSQAELEVRTRLSEQRQLVRQLEESLQREVQRLRSHEGERHSLESDLAALREQSAAADTRQASAREELAATTARQAEATDIADRRSAEARRLAGEAEQARHQVAGLRTHEALERAARRNAEELLAQLSARRNALEELERDRVGLAPGAAALMAARDQFGEAVLGPLSDFVRTSREDAELAERLLGEWIHAVLVRDQAAVRAIGEWHSREQPGAIALLPVGEQLGKPSGPSPLGERLWASDPAAAWVQTLLSGSEVIDHAGRSIRRPNGAILLAGAPSPSGPLRRRAELESLANEVAGAQAAMHRADLSVGATLARLADAEMALEGSTHGSDQARDRERVAIAAREDATRAAAAAAREMAEAEAQVRGLNERLERTERRLVEIDATLTHGELARAGLDEQLGQSRALSADFETQQEAARDARVHWQVQDGQLQARLDAAVAALDRARALGSEAGVAADSLAGELSQIEEGNAQLIVDQSRWIEARAERRVALQELETASAEIDSLASDAERALALAEQALHAGREELERETETYHRLELEMTEATGRRRTIIERIEAEWRKPVDTLFAEAPQLELDLEALEQESRRITEALEAIGPVNALAVEEHAEESKRFEFLTAQRDDLVAARTALHQAIREIDGTARTMFMETFDAIKGNFSHVFQTLFGGGECDLRLANPDDPLESEIDIHAAPRGKRVQRIHLLSTGERYLVAVSLLFSIYLTKPSPFCLMDEVDAPLDDANVNRFIHLLEEFKQSTQFIVITHNPRTMQAAEAVYGVTMQEPGVSTIVGVRLGELERV
ncbi:MAG: hypothetical protein OEW17_03740, partial [Gemmatimonadota bacterium]|nr:hypothetical protein [Gemmatimonadota bacterium]